jgi:hypothetical protein
MAKSKKILPSPLLVAMEHSMLGDERGKTKVGAWEGGTTILN